ncbi:MAG: hypothetical protein LBV33_05435 [Lachnospiraceae bacterium]|nr:hypothetical protein [Lachnospiraceae bacterium]
MNYLWELIMQADREEIDQGEVRFINATNASPYQELSMLSINADSLDEVCSDVHANGYKITRPEDFYDGYRKGLYMVEFNVLYRFFAELGKLVDINLTEMKQTRRIFIDICMHYITRIDLMSGLSKYEYYLWLLREDITVKQFGEKIRTGLALFTAAEKKVIIDNHLKLCRTGNYLRSFKRAVTGIYPRPIIYESLDSADELLVYLGKKETDTERQRIELLIELFLPMRELVYVFYDHHFGIIGVEETMILNEMVLF